MAKPRRTATIRETLPAKACDSRQPRQTGRPNPRLVPEQTDHAAIGHWNSNPAGDPFISDIWLLFANYLATYRVQDELRRCGKVASINPGCDRINRG